jgi:hypothetical protein
VSGKRHLGEEQLAHEAEVDRAYVSRAAVTYVGLEIIGKLATILGAQPAEFLRAALERPAAPLADPVRLLTRIAKP